MNLNGDVGVIPAKEGTQAILLGLRLTWLFFGSTATETGDSQVIYLPDSASRVIMALT